MPFAEALAQLRAKRILPTGLRSAEISREIYRNSLTSARTLIADVLDTYQQRLDQIISPRPESRVHPETGETYTVHVAPSLADVRQEIRGVLGAEGYVPEEGKEGTIEDLGSDQRIRLVVETNADIARGFGWAVQGNDADVLAAFPAQELIRVEHRSQEREWHARWRAALQEAGDEWATRAYGDTQRMVALKDSPVWQALGDGAGGYDSDALGNNFPPFAFNSGMDVQDVSYSEAVELGLLDPGEKVDPIALAYPRTPDRGET